MSEAFTKGPWRWEDEHGFSDLVPPSGGVHEIVYYTNRDDGIRTRNPADAHLIASAPDLYAALEKIVAEIEGVRRAHLSDEDGENPLQDAHKDGGLYQLSYEARCILARARGEAE